MSLYLLPAILSLFPPLRSFLVFVLAVTALGMIAHYELAPAPTGPACWELVEQPDHSWCALWRLKPDGSSQAQLCGDTREFVIERVRRSETPLCGGKVAAR